MLLKSFLISYREQTFKDNGCYDYEKYKEGCALYSSFFKIVINA